MFKQAIIALSLITSATTAVADNWNTAYPGDCVLANSENPYIPHTLDAAIDWEGDFTLWGSSPSAGGASIDETNRIDRDPSNWGTSTGSTIYVGDLNFNNTPMDTWLVQWLFGGVDLHVQNRYTGDVYVYQCSFPVIQDWKRPS